MVYDSQLGARVNGFFFLFYTDTYTSDSNCLLKIFKILPTNTDCKKCTKSKWDHMRSTSLEKKNHQHRFPQSEVLR